MQESVLRCNRQKGSLRRDVLTLEILGVLHYRTAFSLEELLYIFHTCSNTWYHAPNLSGSQLLEGAKETQVVIVGFSHMVVAIPGIQSIVLKCCSGGWKLLIVEGRLGGKYTSPKYGFGG